MRASNSLAFAAILVLGGCGGSDSSQPPVEVSLVAPASTDIAEAAGEKVRVAVAVDRIASTSILATLVISGSATRGQDYEASAESIIIPAYTPSASVEVDVYRDFDMEGDETITISLGEIEGNGQAGARTSIDLVILDGEPANPDKTPGDHEDSIPIFPTHFFITEESVEFGAVVFNFALEGCGAAPVVRRMVQRHPLRHRRQFARFGRYPRVYSGFPDISATAGIQPASESLGTERNILYKVVRGFGAGRIGCRSTGMRTRSGIRLRPTPMAGSSPDAWHL